MAEPEPLQVWSFQRTTRELGEGIVDRLPASADRTVLIPPTNLFPGGARIDPAIDHPYSGEAAAIAAGERHFAAFNCAGCHAPLGGGGMGSPLSDDEWIYGAEPAQIYLTIMHGRPEGMPAFGSMLPRQTIWELVAHIETLNEIEDPAAELGFDPPRGEDGSAGEDENAQASQWMRQPSGSHRMQAAACAIAAAGRFLPVGVALALAACSGQQSALQPSGSGAREAAILWWVMLAGAVLVFALVLALLLYAVLQPPERRRPISVDRMVMGGGIALPVVALSLLLVFGLRMGSST